MTYPTFSSKKSQKRLLITGSTGFVGRNLLLHALHDPEWSEIILPVRNQKKFQAQLKLARIFHTDLLRRPGSQMDVALDSHCDLDSMYTYSPTSKCSSALPHKASQPPRHDQYEICELAHLEDSWQRIRLCSVKDNTWDLSGMPPIDMAIHCAGLTFSRDRNPYFQTHVEGSLHLLESLPKSCPLLVLSSQAAAGPSSKMIPLRHENHSEKPLSWYGESKYEMEKVLLHHAGDRLLIVRPPMVLGPRDQATIPLFKMAHGPVRFKPGFQKKYFSWIAVHDLCEAILTASKQDWSSLPQRIYFITHPHAITDLELLNTAAALAHARGINLPLPHIMIQLISSIADKIPKLRSALPSLGRDRVKEIFPQRWIIDGSAFERDFHWKAHKELYETLEETMIWLQQSGEI